MNRALLIPLILVSIFSCKKDKVEAPCTNVSMVGERERFVGKWKWYNTIVEEWFDVGPSIFHNYTPASEGFQYYFTISQSGDFKGYRNDTLVHDFLLTGVPEENFNGVDFDYFLTKINCGVEELDFQQWVWYNTKDSLFTGNYPFDFRDEIEQRESKQNFFVRE
jgi:hypothetical protein